MKHHFIALLMAMITWSMTHAHTVINPPFPKDKSIHSLNDNELMDLSLIRIRICVNLVVASVCIELDCDLHWTDIIQPGTGQLLGHKGCRPVGVVAGHDGVSKSFEGSEDMIKVIEELSRVPTGSIKFLEVLKSPTFPGPDGETYQVVPKNYEIKSGPDGRYIPLEIELVKS